MLEARRLLFRNPDPQRRIFRFEKDTDSVLIRIVDVINEIRNGEIREPAACSDARNEWPVVIAA